MQQYTAPAFQLPAFHCGYCGVYSKHVWGQVSADNTIGRAYEVNIAKCEYCSKYSIWLNEKMVAPSSGLAPLPNQDLPEKISQIFEEARSIVAFSPRASAALLRLCIEEICIDQEVPGNNLNAQIGELVQQGISHQIQQSLDSVRVVGNNAIHPGQIDVDDNPDIANALFQLVNYIANDLYTKPKEIKAIYADLPEGSLEGIEQRDSQK